MNDTEKIDRSKVVNAVREYVCFLVDSRPENPADVASWDLRRRTLHNRIGTALGFKDLDTWRDWYDNVSTHVDTWKDAFDDFEEYVSWEADNLIDKVSKNSPIRTEYAFKYRSRKAFDAIRKHIEDRMQAARTVLDAAVGDCRAWCHDHESEERSKPVKWPNGHDFNRYEGLVKRYLEQMDTFVGMPREAYLAASVKEYYADPADQAFKCVQLMEGVAFQTERLYEKSPYYKYREKMKKRQERKD